MPILIVPPLAAAPLADAAVVAAGAVVAAAVAGLAVVGVAALPPPHPASTKPSSSNVTSGKNERRTTRSPFSSLPLRYLRERGAPGIRTWYGKPRNRIAR
jgi:hypothetical protein